MKVDWSLATLSHSVQAHKQLDKNRKSRQMKTEDRQTVRTKGGRWTDRKAGTTRRPTERRDRQVGRKSIDSNRGSNRIGGMVREAT